MAALNAAVKDYGSNQSADTGNEFNKMRHVINETTQRIRRNNVQMQRMVSQIGGPNDTLDLRDKLHKLQHQTNELAKETSKNLQTFMSLPLTTTNPKQQRQIREQITEEFTTILKDFQGLQRLQMNEEKDALTKKKTADQQNILDAGQDHFSTDLFGDDRNLQDQMFLESDDLERIEDTEGQIRKLESDISDINQVFRDLSLLVHQQADFVDSIEANTETAGISVSRGADELFKARRYRDKIRRRKLILIVITTVIISLIILIIIISASRSSST